jgi:hypothetical protein
MSDEITYQFRAGTRIPKGATPAGVMQERDRIEHDYGKVTIKTAADAVVAHPEKFPVLRSFGPPDSETAMRDGIERGIRTAFQSVIIQRIEPKQKVVARQVRVIHSVKDSGGDLVYRPIEAIRQEPDQRKYLIGQLRRDAELFADKMRDVLAEIEEAS